MPFINELLEDLKLVPTGPPYWDEAARAWKMPVAPKMYCEEEKVHDITPEEVKEWKAWRQRVVYEAGVDEQLKILHSIPKTYYWQVRETISVLPPSHNSFITTK